MTDQTHTRLSDGAMAKVIAEWMGWQYEPRIEHGCPHLCSALRERWRAPLANMTGEYEQDFIFDPRTDTDAALMLLIYTLKKWSSSIGGTYMLSPNEKDEMWDVVLISTAGDFRPWATIPISGEPFRYAVCNLAAKVLGVEGGG